MTGYASVLGALLTAALLAPPASSPEPGRSVAGPAAAPWPAERSGTVEVGTPASTASGAPSSESAPVSDAPVPAPQRARPQKSQVVRVAVGLDPTAPGSKAERAQVDELRDSVAASAEPTTKVRRLRAGSPAAREVCRDGRDDLVILVGYVARRPEAVLLAYDCGLDVALGVRDVSASTEPGLVASLWLEHDALVRDGVQERRRRGRLGPGARAGIVAGVAVAVIGVAVGLLVANTLRDEVVVLKVGQ